MAIHLVGSLITCSRAVRRSKVGLSLDLVATKWLTGSDNGRFGTYTLKTFCRGGAEVHNSKLLSFCVVSIPGACAVRQSNLSLLFTPGVYSRRCTRVCLYCSVGLSESSRPPNFST
jgi:hypothetical protein